MNKRLQRQKKNNKDEDVVTKTEERKKVYRYKRSNKKNYKNKNKM